MWVLFIEMVSIVIKFIGLGVAILAFLPSIASIVLVLRFFFSDKKKFIKLSKKNGFYISLIFQPVFLLFGMGISIKLLNGLLSNWMIYLFILIIVIIHLLSLLAIDLKKIKKVEPFGILGPIMYTTFKNKWLNYYYHGFVGLIIALLSTLIYYIF